MYEINADQDLLKLNSERISDDCYYDKNSHILTQDFIFAVTVRWPDALPIAKNKINIPIAKRPEPASNYINKKQESELTPKIINYYENNAEKKRIGDLGEQFVLKYERKRLEALGKENLASQIKHIASEMGDGAGFDIESYNEDGTTRFIEVKTTKGNLDQPIYITHNELMKSTIEKDKYFLYRIYDYDEITDQAKVEIVSGDLTHLCDAPILYKISLNKVPNT